MASEGWENENTIWTDGPRLENRGIGAVAVWRENAHRPQALQRANPRRNMTTPTTQTIE